MRLGPGSYVYDQKGLLHGLTWKEVQHFMITAAVGGWIAKPAVSVGIGLLHWNYHVFKDQTNWLELDTWITSPGGGGPGSVVTSTTPVSLEATGASLVQLGKTEGPARASKRGSRPRRKKCPPGFRWSRRLQTCIFSDKPKGYGRKYS